MKFHDITEDRLLLEPELRAKVIEDIEGGENVRRKRAHQKRYDLYRDGFKKHVLDIIKSDFGEETAQDAEHRMSTINFIKKIVTKKARVYKDVVTRMLSDSPRSRFGILIEKVKKALGKKMGKERETLFGSLVTASKLNTLMKKVDRILKLQYNLKVRVVPVRDAITGKYYPKATVLQPQHYDVIEDPEDPERDMCVILTTAPRLADADPVQATQDTGRELTKPIDPDQPMRYGDATNQRVADSPADMGDKAEYIWWTSHYHFTTNNKGEIIRVPFEEKKGLAEQAKNPVEELPFINFSSDQDNSFWALGGDDFVDSSILLNVLLTDVNFIAKFQGMGIFYAYGKDIPMNLSIGPNKALILNMENDDPTPGFGFAQAPPHW